MYSCVARLVGRTGHPRIIVVLVCLAFATFGALENMQEEIIALVPLHVPVPSVSGQAVLTMPVMAPLCDLLAISWDAGVIAYKTGAGLMDLITPTNGALLAMLLAADVPDVDEIVALLG